MDYKELKDNYQKNIDSLHFMVCFSTEWFVELMELKQDHGKAYNIWGGCFADEDNYQKLCQFTKEFEDYIKNKLEEKDEDFIVGAIEYEMTNFEYPYSRDTEEVLNALWFDEKVFEWEWFAKMRKKAEKKVLSKFDW